VGKTSVGKKFVKNLIANPWLRDRHRTGEKRFHLGQYLGVILNKRGKSLNGFEQNAKPVYSIPEGY